MKTFASLFTPDYLEKLRAQKLEEYRRSLEFARKFLELADKPVIVRAKKPHGFAQEKRA